MSGPNTHNVGLLAATIAGDACALQNLITLICADLDDQDVSDRLQAHAALVGRIGLLADRIAAACGRGRHRAPAKWLLQDDEAELAFEALAQEVRT